MHRSLKPHHAQAQAKKVPPPAIPGDPQPQQHQLYHHHQHQHQHQHHQQQQQQQQIPLYRLGGSISSASAVNDGAGIIMSSLVSSPSLEEGGFNLPRETSVALRMKDEIVDYATAMSATGGVGGVVVGNNNSITAAQTNTAAAAAAAAAKQQQQPAVVVVATAATLNTTANTNPLLAAAGCPPTIVPCAPPVFCATLREPLTHKAAVYYHQQLALQEDQGIDLTQSPGRDSPGSSSGSAGSGSRHSTASLDSGRASSYLTGVSGTSIRGGGGGALSSPRCSSVSSCSIGSVDRQRNDELIIDWLMEMKYEEYAQLFIAAGYDLPTIARMTPEDLTAIGIKNPHHRERIKQRIDKLQVLDNLPHFVPGSIEEWLQLLRLEEYIQPLLDQNYKTVRDVTQVTWEDLEDIGIVKLGHQKKILLAIKRVKDIISGKWNPGGVSAYHQQEYRKACWPLPMPPLAMPLSMPTTTAAGAGAATYLPTTRVSWDDSRIYGTSNAIFTHANAANVIYGHAADAYYCTGSNHECCNGNDVVLIKVRQPRGKSLESLEDIHDNSTRSHLTFSHYTTTDYGHFAHPSQLAQHQQALAAQHQQHQLQQQQQQQQQQAAMMSAGGANRLLTNPATMSWRRSYDDGDITPTNDAAAARDMMYEEGGGTLPRQQRGGILQRAVLNSMPPLEHHHYMNAAAAAEYLTVSGGVGGGGVLPLGAVVVGGGASVAGNAAALAGGVLDSSSLTAPYLTGSPMSSKKIAPEPPRRHCSIRNSRTLSSDGGAVQLQQQQQQPPAMHPQSLYYGGGAMQHHPGAVAYMQQQQQPIYANYATIQQTTAEIHCEKFHDNKSNSSIDSIDTIPFANENTGTIKQRLLNRQEMSLQAAQQQQQQQSSTTHLHSSSSSSSSSSTNTIANITHSFHSLKSSSSLHDTASLIRSDSIGSNTSGGSAGPTSAGGMLLLRSPTLQYPADANTITTTVDLHTPSGGGAVGAATPADAVELAGGDAVSVGGANVGPKVSANVLNDIGNMLANLTDELDAMLEEEKRVGLNIDSE